jgi:ABC-type glycerol-3-phosphate transport system substrate-binding protein
MQWERGRVGFLFCLVCLTIQSAGCRPKPIPSSWVELGRQKELELRIACPNEEIAYLVQSRGQSWALQQGVQLKCEIYDGSDEKALQSRASSPDDIWIIAPAELPRWAAAGQLAPLPESYRTRDNPYAWSDLVPAYREQLSLWEHAVYGLPLIGESPLCFYRADWLAEPRHRDAIREKFGPKFEGPLTWEQFAQLAGYFREHGPKGQFASLPPLPRSDAALDRLFYTVAAGFARRAVPTDEPRSDAQQDDVFSFHYDLKSGRPRIASPGFVEALKWLQRVQACRPPEPTEHPEEAFREGRAVLCVTDALWAKTFQKVQALRDRFGVCRVPGAERYFDYEKGTPRETPAGNRVPYLGGAGWLAVVPKSGRHAEAAFEFLVGLTGPKTSTQIFLSGKDHGGPTRTDQLYRSRWDTFDLDEKQELRLREALQEALLHRGLRNPAICLRTPRQAAHRAVLVKAIREALLKGTDPEKTLRGVAEAWRKLDEGQGFKAHQEDYRRSLGLMAQ